MYSNRRKPYIPRTHSLSSTSSDNSYRPTYRRSSPVVLRQLVVRDLDEPNSIDRNQSSSSQRESFRIPKPILPIPRPSLYIPRDNRLWTTDSQSTHLEDVPSFSNSSLQPQVTERPFYQIVAPPTPPPPPIQYRFIPISFQQSLPIRTYRRLRRKKYVQEKTPGLCTTLCSGGFGSIAVLIYLMAILALPIAKLVLGIIHIKDCEINKNIPLYMIISGAGGLSLIFFLLLSSTCKFCRSSTIARKSTHRFMICTTALARGMQGVLAIFLFIWFFFGNYWVFSARPTLQTNNPDQPSNYCHPTLYWFAFYVLIFTYVYAIFMCFMKFCSSFFCCGACDIWRRAFS